jgi:hypothetical protein
LPAGAQYVPYFLKLLTSHCSEVFSLCDVMDALQTAAHSLHRDTSAAAAATLAETIRQGCKDVQSRAVFLAQVQAWRNTHTHSVIASSDCLNRHITNPYLLIVNLQ